MKVANTCNFYSDGFFGYGLKGDFSYWSFWHFLPIFILILLIILIYKYKDKLRNSKYEENIRFIVAFIMILLELSYYWRLLYAGSGSSEYTTLLTKLPIQVCDWVCIIASFMLMKKSKFLYKICYFISLTLGLLPLITPAVIVTTGPSYFRYYQYWLIHILPIASVFYMMFVHDFNVKYKDIIKPAIFLIAMAFIAIYFNSIIPKANFMFLAANTPGDSLANIMPSNVWIRLILYIFIGLILLSLAYIPMYLRQRKK